MRDEYEPIWPVQGRDFSIVQEIHFMESGGLVVTSYSVVEPRIPEKPG